MNHITIELCTEDRELLREIRDALCKEPVAQPQEVEAPEPAVVSMADIQKKIVDLSAAGMKSQVRDVVKAYAERVSLIPEEKLSEVYALLEALEIVQKEAEDGGAN